jgi:hypothetical protein
VCHLPEQKTVKLEPVGDLTQAAQLEHAAIFRKTQLCHVHVRIDELVVGALRQRFPQLCHQHRCDFVVVDSVTLELHEPKTIRLCRLRTRGARTYAQIEAICGRQTDHQIGNQAGTAT